MPSNDDVEVSRIRKFGPEEAEAFLKLNQKNRRVSHQWVHNLARYITNDEWIFDGTPIRVGMKDGKPTLLDGQHRCLAVVRAGKPIDTLVINGLSAESQKVMDTNKRRGFHDYLSTQGISDATSLSALVRFMLTLESNGFGPSLGERASRPMWSTPELWDRFEKDEEALREALRMGNHVRAGRLPVNKTAAAALWYKIQKLEDEEANNDAEDFFEKLTYGANIDENSPIISLRKQIYYSQDKKFRYHWYQYALLTKTWNAYREGRTIKFLAYRPGGKSPEKFPTPQ